MILRFLHFFLILFFLFLLVRLFLSTWRRRPGDRSAPSRPEPMVFDPQCRSYLPKSDAILRKGHYFCSELCARLYLVD